MNSTSRCAVGAAALAIAPLAQADLVYQNQQREISVFTSFDANMQTAAAPGFGPFVQSLLISTEFPTSGGGTGVNGAGAGIDCQLDPNAITVGGSLSGSGGVSVQGGQPAPQFGEADALVFTTFDILAGASFRLMSSPRPSLNPRDEFEIELANVLTGERIFFIDATSAPQTVDVRGFLAPGRYSIQYQVELTVEAEQTIEDFSFNFTIPAPGTCGVLALAGFGAVRRRRTAISPA
jgi:hypothetical protein